MFCKTLKEMLKYSHIQILVKNIEEEVMIYWRFKLSESALARGTHYKNIINEKFRKVIER